MRLWPKSLVGRNALLIVGLMVVAQLISGLLVRELVTAPRLAQLAETVATNVEAMRAGLAALPPNERAAFVAGFGRNGGRAPAGEASGGSGNGGGSMGRGDGSGPPLTRLERRFVRAVSARLAADGVETVWRREGRQVLALRLVVDGSIHWLPVETALPGRETTGAWLAATLAAALLALLGALAIQRRLDRPLRALVGAARALGRGERPPRLGSGGPVEIATVSHAFDQLVDDLDSAESERSLMLAGISHDLRTPLTKLRLGVEILAERAGPELRGNLERSVAEIDAVVAQFLDYARSGDEAALPLEPTMLDALARAEAASFGGAPSLALALELQPTPALALRAPLVRRALANLLENAGRHGAPPLVLRSGCDAGCCWVEVEDGGPGIAADQVEAMTRPFRRGQRAPSTPGTGLGLAIAARVARMHGGRLELRAAAPRGLVARLVLPRPADDVGVKP